MQKRRETMEDGRRYIIYYTFGTDGEPRTAPGAEQDQGIENV